MIFFEDFVFTKENNELIIKDKLGNRYVFNKKTFFKAVNKLIEESYVETDTHPSVKFVNKLVEEMETHFGKDCLFSKKKASKKDAEARAIFNYIVLHNLGNNSLSRGLIQQHTRKDRTAIYHYEKNLLNKVHLVDTRIYNGDYVCNWFWRLSSKVEGVDYSSKLKKILHNKIYENKIKSEFDKHKFQFLDAFRDRKDYTAIKLYLNKIPKREVVEVLMDYDEDFREIILSRKYGR